jgi:uncharacterized protein (DUF2062 family)
MLFRRRTPLTWVARIRVALWPSNGWGRSLRYFGKRVLRLSGSPHAIALGFACGVFASWTPFMGFHIALSAAIAFIIGGNFVAAGLGTVVGNPLTFPFIWWSSLELGKRLLHVDAGHVRLANLADQLAHAPFSALLPIIKPMTAGAIPLGLASAIVAYVIVATAVGAYQRSRQNRLLARRQHLADAGQAAE